MVICTSDLSIAAQADAALTPEQRKYNQLVMKIEAGRETLLAWDEEVPRFAVEYQKCMQPLITQLAQQRLQLVRRLAVLLETGGLTKTARRTMTRSLCEEVTVLTVSEFIAPADVTALEELHERYAEVSLSEIRQAELAQMKNMFESMTGMDLGDEVFDSPEDLMHAAHQRVRASTDAADQRSTEVDSEPDLFADMNDSNDSTQPRASTRRRSAAHKAAQKLAAEQAQATQSVREVFRQLASALHPDRAVDDADRDRRTGLMQRVNQMYEAQDLLGLFKLQLEIEQIDDEHLARASTEKLRHYNRVLAKQMNDLDEEILQRQEMFLMQYEVDDWRKLNPRRLAWVLKDKQSHIRNVLADYGQSLRLLQSPVGVKSWLQRERFEHRMDDDDPFQRPIAQ